MAIVNKLHVGEDNGIEWDGMKRSDTDTYINNATVTYGLYASEALALAAGVSLATGTLTYVSSSNGIYRGVLESSQYTLVKNTAYWLRLNATSGTMDGQRIIRCAATLHGVESH